MHFYATLIHRRMKYDERLLIISNMANVDAWTKFMFCSILITCSICMKVSESMRTMAKDSKVFELIYSGDEE